MVPQLPEAQSGVPFHSWAGRHQDQLPWGWLQLHTVGPPRKTWLLGLWGFFEPKTEAAG